MDLDYSSAADAFRADIRAWLEADLPRALRAKVLDHKRLNREKTTRAGTGYSARAAGRRPRGRSNTAAPGGTRRSGTSGTRSARIAALPDFMQAESA